MIMNYFCEMVDLHTNGNRILKKEKLSGSLVIMTSQLTEVITNPRSLERQFVMLLLHYGVTNI